MCFVHGHRPRLGTEWRLGRRLGPPARGLAGSYYYPYSANPNTRIDSLQIFWDRVCLRLNPFACAHRYTVQPFSSTYHWEARQTGFTAGTSPTIRVIYTNVCALPPQLCLALHSTTLTITRTPSGVHVDIDTRSQFSSSHTSEDLIPTWEVG